MNNHSTEDYVNDRRSKALETLEEVDILIDNSFGIQQ